jgi:hypothetical protein
MALHCEGSEPLKLLWARLLHVGGQRGRGDKAVLSKHRSRHALWRQNHLLSPPYSGGQCYAVGASCSLTAAMGE